MYIESERILALGESNHNNPRIFEYLKALLERHGTDPQLKYIFLERDPEKFSSYFEAISTQLSTEKLKRDLIKYEATIQTLETGRSMPADPYLLKEIFPLIQSLNAQRPKDNPLIVKAIGGSIQAMDQSVESRRQEIKNFFRPDQLHYGTSWNREDATLRNFKKVIRELPSDGKVIIVYHIFHLIQNLDARLPRSNPERNLWEAPDWHPMSWFGMFIQQYPEFREKTKIVFFDEKDVSEIGNWAPDGTVNLSGINAEASGGLARFAFLRACNCRDIPPSCRLICPPRALPHIPRVFYENLSSQTHAGQIFEILLHAFTDFTPHKICAISC